MQMKKTLVLLQFCLLALISTSSLAQMSANPPEVGAKIRAMGADLTPEIIENTNKLYGPLLAAAPKGGVAVLKDAKYGPEERNVLDVYEPDKKPTALMPILVFLHGGGFVRGDKAGAANIGTYFARHGVLAVIMNYRFAPKNQWPSGAEDIAAALKWIRQNGGKHGGDINRIFLMGSSAGTAHVSSYVFFEDFQIKDGDGVAGAILFSGPTYDTSRLNERDMVYYGKDESKHPVMSAIANVDGRKIPLFLVIAELDMPSIVYQNHALINALYKRDKALPFMKVLIGHNHISETTHFNTKDESVGPDILEFMKACVAKAK
jgi:acetyl esterase/lipase